MPLSYFSRSSGHEKLPNIQD